MTNLIDLIKAEFNRRMLVESYERISTCLQELTPEQIWHKENENTNSVGNLILHLQGNITQYIWSGIGGNPDLRERDKEFLSGYTYKKERLLEDLLVVVTKANDVVQQLEESDLTKDVKVQGFDETVISILIHVMEHMSYHVGQITYYTKYINDVDTSYYGGLDLNAT